MSTRPLTHKQSLFCAGYAGEAKGNAVEAARVAGHSIPEGSAAKNMEEGQLLAEVQRLTEEAQQARGALSPAEIRQFRGQLARDEPEPTTIQI